MVIDNGIHLSGEYYIELLGPDMRVKERRYAPNLITDAGLNKILADTMWSDVLNSIAIGSGSTAPSTTDTALQAQIAIKAIGSARTDTQTPPSTLCTVQFGESEGNGTIAELGVMTASTVQTFSRIVLGTPITKVAGDYLVVKYKLNIDVGALQTYTVTDNRSQAWTIKSILSNKGAYSMFFVTFNRWSADNWSGTYWGNNNTTDPSATQTGLIGTGGQIVDSTSQVSFTTHNGPSGGFYKDVQITSLAGKGTGTWKELWTRGYNAAERTAFSARYTINDGAGGGLVKGADDVVKVTFRYTFTR